MLYFIGKKEFSMKFNRVFGAVLATVMAVTSITSSAAAKPDNLAYAYQAEKAGQTEDAAPYAGMNYEGGEQGDTSSYSYQASRIGKPWNTAE